LIKGPFIALGAYISSPVRSFNTAQEEHRLQMETQERARCAEVVEQATPAQLKILRAFARELSPRQVAEELQISLNTVNSHNTFLFSYCRKAWSIPEEERLNYIFLRSKFAGYFQDR
jgi:CRISPR-associated protein Csx14